MQWCVKVDDAQKHTSYYLQLKLQSFVSNFKTTSSLSIESPMTVYFCSNARALVGQLVSDRKFQRPRLESWLDLIVIFLNTGPIAFSTT